MKKFVIERIFPGAGELTPVELQQISQNTCDALVKLKNSCHWVHSYVTEDKIYCVYIADSKEVVREHARLGKFPVNTISEVKAIIDPTTSNPLLVA